MTLPFWGQLEKAQDDDETIEEAIVRLIVGHEEDPTAHLGDGESLQSHKSEEVIDHPAGSIVSDKLSFYDYQWSPSFESLDSYPDSFGVTCNYAGTFKFTVEFGFDDNAYLEMSSPLLSDTYNENKNMVYAFSARFENTPLRVTGYLQWENLRWWIVDGVLSARFYNGTSYNEISLSSIVLTDSHYYKIVYSALDEEALFYIDGVLVATIERPTGTKYTSSYAPFVDITALAGSDYYLFYSNLFYSREA